MTAPRNYVTCLVAAVILAACSALPQPRNFDDTLVIAYATLTAARATNTEMVATGAITVEEAIHNKARADDIREALQEAERLRDFRQLDTATALLRAYTRELNERSPPP
jgi:hypothetical protein